MKNALTPRQKILSCFASGIFSKGKKLKGKGCPSVLARVAKVSDHKQRKTLTLKQMLPRFPIALAQIKAGNTSENLLNAIRQIIYSLYWTKEITKKVYKNIINSITF